MPRSLAACKRSPWVWRTAGRMAALLRAGGVANGGEDRVLFKVGEWCKAVASGLERSTGLHEQRAGKMLGANLILCVHRASPLDRILKLPDIARPLIFQQTT